MALTDLFYPKWKHSDPEVRRRAVAEMDWTASSDALRDVAATDTDARVREAAIERIEDESFLSDLLSRTPDFNVSLALGRRLNGLREKTLLAAPDTGARLLALSLIDDQETLERIVRDLDDVEIRLAAVAKIGDPVRRCRLSFQNCGLKVGLVIVDSLEDPELLKNVAEKASNKKVARQAREKLAALTGEPIPSGAGDPADDDGEAGTKSLTTLCERLEAVPDHAAPESVRALLIETGMAWRRIDSDTSHSLYPRFTETVTRLESLLARDADRRRIIDSLSALCQRMERLSPESEDDARNDIATAWDAETGAASPTVLEEKDRKPLTERFRSAVAAFDAARADLERRRAEAGRRRDRMADLVASAEAESRKEGALDETAWAGIEARWRAENSDEFHDLAVRFREAGAEISRRRSVAEAELAEKRSAQETTLRECLAAVETAVGATERTGLDRKVRDFQKIWKETGELVADVKESLKSRFDDACHRFFAAQNDFYDQRKWEYWANLNRKTELCELVERLAGEDIATGVVAVVREAQKSWKETGAVDRTHADAIWRRFSSACDVVFEKALAEKKALHATATELLPESFGESLHTGDTADNGNSADEGIHWTDVTAKLKDIQARWNAVGMLPLALEKDLREDFQAMCNRFFERRRLFFQHRDQERERNMACKLALCEQAEALASSTDWRRTASEFRDLQRQWKEAGPVPRKDNDVLWRRFRAACDAFFDRMKAVEPDHLARREDLCRRAEEIVAGLGPDTDMERAARDIIALQKEWKESGPVPVGRMESLWTRFRAACDAFFERHKEHLRERDERQSENERRKAALVERAESLAEAEDWKETAAILKGLQREWKALGPAPRKVDQELWRCFREACDRFFQRRDDFFADRNERRRDGLKRRETLCVAVESLAQLVLPEEALNGLDAAVRTAEHLRMGLDYKEEVVVPGNPKTTWTRAIRKVQDLQKEWRSAGPSAGEADERLWRRFRTAADLFFNRRDEATSPARETQATPPDDAASGSAGEQPVG